MKLSILNTITFFSIDNMIVLKLIITLDIHLISCMVGDKKF